MVDVEPHPAKVVCFLFDPNVGGPTIRARAVYEQMMADGYEIRIALPAMEGTATGYLLEKGLAVDRLPIAKPVLPRKIGPFLKFAVTSPFSLWRVYRYLKKQAPDVVHVNGAFDVIPAMAAKLAGVPLVWHLNDTVFGKKLSVLLGKVVQKTATVVVIAATRVGEHYGVMNANPHVIFAPVDVDRFSPVARDPQDPPVLTLIGNWNWIKGQDRFVALIAGLKDHGIDVRGLMVGKFLESQEAFWTPILQEIQDRGLSDAIEAPGFKSDMAEVLRGSDVFVLTSHSEASPISLLEAMAMGVPSLCFDVGGVAEMMDADGEDPAGLVVPEGDVEALQEAAMRLLSDRKTYAALGAAGRRRVVEHYSLSACVCRHKLAYASAIEKFEVRSS